MSKEVVVVCDDEAQSQRVHQIGVAASICVRIAKDVNSAPRNGPLMVFGDPERMRGTSATHIVRVGIPDDQLQMLLVAFATGYAPEAPPQPALPRDIHEAHLARAAFAASRKLAATMDLASAEEAAVSAVSELLDAERAYCLFFETDSGALWSQARELVSGDERQAVAGMAGWSARTGLPCNAEVAC